MKHRLGFGAISCAALLTVVACSVTDGSSTTRFDIDAGAQIVAASTTAPTATVGILPVASPPLEWSTWTTLNGGLLTDPSIFADGAGHVGAVATTGTVWFDWFATTTWGGWVDLGNAGNALTAPPVAVVAGNHIEVFVVDSTSGFLIHKEGTFPSRAVEGAFLASAPTWSGWETIPLLQSNGVNATGTGYLAPAARPPAVVVSQPNNQINVFATFNDGTTKTTHGAGFGAMSLWTDLSGSAIYEPGAVSWGSNRLDVFVVGSDNLLYHRYSNDNGVTWGPGGTTWEKLYGNVASAPSVVSWGPNRLDVFVTGRPSGRVAGVQHLAWTGSGWGACGSPPCWDDMSMLAWQDGQNGPMPAPVAISRGVGDMTVFWQGIAQQLFFTQMTGVSPPTWGNAQVLTDCFRTGGTPAVISPDNVGIDLVMTAFSSNGDGPLYAISSSGGAQFALNGLSNPPSCSIGYAGGPCQWPLNSCFGDGASCNAQNVCTCNAGYVEQASGGEQVCVPLGVENNPCWPDGTCNAGELACRNDICKPSGHAGLPCNPGSPLSTTSCDANSRCVVYSDGTDNCVAAGAPGQLCTSNWTCNSGAICNDQTVKCTPLGVLGDSCNSDGTCIAGAPTCECGSSFECVNGKCAALPACVASGKACSAGGAACCSGLSCENGVCATAPTCKSTGGACSGNASCCNGLTCQSGKCETAATTCAARMKAFNESCVAVDGTPSTIPVGTYSATTCEPHTVDLVTAEADARQLWLNQNPGVYTCDTGLLPCCDLGYAAQ